MAVLGQQFKSRVAIVDQEATSFLEFDAMVQATYTGTSQLTDHPVEGSLDVTDHIRQMPLEITLRGIVSNHPIVMLASARAKAAVNGGDPSARASEAFYFLESIRQLGQLVQITTSLFDETDMAITSLSCTRDKDTNNIVDISLTLRKLQIAVTETVAAPATPTKPTNLGKKVKKPAPPAAAVKSQSLLVRITNAFGG